MKRFLFKAHLVFVLIGIATTILGPLLPVLARRWHLGDGESGGLFLAQFVGGFVGAITSTRLTRHWSLQVITRLGLGLVGLGFLGLASPWHLLAIAGIAVYGIGIGLCTPSVTAAVSEAVPERTASVLNLLNFAWAIGAITAPVMVLLALQHTNVNVPRMLTAFALVVAASAMLVPASVRARFVVGSAPSRLPANTMRLIVTCGVLIFIYVGIENGVAGWLPTYAMRLHAFTIRRGALLQDAFWTAFLAGRFFAPGFLRSLSERALLTLSICAAVVGTSGLLLVNATAAVFASVVVLGAGCAAIFPTAIAVLTHRLPGRSGQTLGFMFASAGLGAAFLPFCIGSLSSAYHDLRIGMALLLVAEGALLAAHLAMSHFAAHDQPVSPQALAASRPA